MSTTKLPDIPFSALSLEPLPGEAPEAPITGKANFTANTRSGKDRRQGVERRDRVRYSADRRKANRRPTKKNPFDGTSI